MGIFFSLPVLAAHAVPKLNPLQPVPQGVGANTSQNINSKDSPTNKALQQLQNQIPDNNLKSVPADQTSSLFQNQTQTPVPQESGLFYWILLFIGILGLGGVLIWAYIRFGKL